MQDPLLTNEFTQAYCISNSHCPEENICPPHPRMFVYRTQSFDNRQTDDVILSSKSFFFKSRRGLGQTPNPVVRRITNAWPLPILHRVEKKVLPLSHIQVH